MNKFNLKSVFRSAKKNKVISFAKLSSIIISFAIVLFASAYVFFELSFDKYIPDHDRIFRCYMDGKLNNESIDLAVTSPRMAQHMVDEIPEIEKAVRLVSDGEALLNINDQKLSAGNLLLADTSFFSFFSIPVEKVLNNPLESVKNLAISKSLAKKYFGSSENALNKVVELNSEECAITGIFDDFPKNSHLQFDLIQSIQKSNPEEKDWDYQSYITYVKTNSKVTDIDKLSFKISKLVYTHSHDYIDGEKAQTWEDLKSSDERYLRYRVEPLTDVHFSSHKFDVAETSGKTYVYGTVVLAFLILLISLINFVNLSIADISSRLKEIGLYKTAGANNMQIIAWVIFESLIYWSFGFFMALLIYSTAGNYFAQHLGLELFISTSLLLKIAGLLFFVLIIVNLIANVPQILFISKRKVLSLLKDDSQNNMAFRSRKGLVFFQFVLAALIIQGTFLVQKQINYIINSDKGYESENVLMFSLGGLEEKSRGSFINQLKSNTSIKNVATSWAFFGEDLGNSTAFFETQEDDNSVQSSILSVDAEFQEVFQFEIKEGRFFENERPTDFNTVVLNEAAVAKYQKTGSLIGKNLYLYSSEKPYQIIGITNDFNYRSLHHKIEPLVIKYAEYCNKVFVKTDHSQISQTIKEIQKQWDEFNIQEPFKYKFHNELLAAHYEKEQQAKRILFVLSIISILITCIGLYAISYFIIKKKIKEIGIRKVNGASISEILTMLNRDFVKWVVIAFVFATPVAWYAMFKWLENFAYKTDLSWWIFALAGLLTLGIALLTVSWQSWRAATRNPVEALRYE